MDGFTAQIGVYVLASVAAGGLLGWLVRGVSSKRALDKVRDDLQMKYDEAARQRSDPVHLAVHPLEGLFSRLYFQERHLVLRHQAAISHQQSLG